MRIIARKTLLRFMEEHPEARPAVERWHAIVKAARWASMNDIQAAFSGAKVLNADRVRFEIAGGNYRLVVAFDFRREVAYIKFIGTHHDYDKVDALTVSQF